MSRSLLRSIACTAVLALGACGASPPQPVTKTATAALRDADQAAMAAVRAWAVTRNAAEANNYAAQAVRLAPQRPELVWLQLRICMETPRCDPQPFAAALKRLAPDNGAVWLSALARAQSEKDLQTEAQLVQAISASAHVNVYWTTLVSRLAPALNASAPARTELQAAAPLTTSLNEISGWLSRLMLPAFAPLNTACEASRIRQQIRRALCERIAGVLAASDSYAAEGLGLGIEQRLGAPDSSDGMNVQQRIDTLAYQNRAAAAVSTAQLEREKFSQQLIELMRKLPREQDVSLAVLRWAGQPLTP